MNIKIHTVKADITGKTDTAIKNSILKGERSEKNILPLIDGRIKADHSTIELSFQRNWREE